MLDRESLRLAAVLAITLAAALPTLALEGPGLAEARVSHALSVARDTTGRVAVWDWKTKQIRVWNSEGELQNECTPGDVRVGNEPSQFTIRKSRAFLKFNDPLAGDDKRQRALVVDLDHCKAVHEIRLEGIVRSLEPSPSGWLLALNRDLLASDRYRLVELDDQGDLVREFTYERPLRDLVREMEIDDLSGPMSGRLLTIGQEAWFIPNASYSLWRLPQRGLPLRQVEVPDCLQARGRRVSGDENAELYRAMLKDETEADRKQWMKGTMRDSFEFATTSAAANRRTLGVVVRDPRMQGGQRLDIWEMLTESIVAIVAIPEGTSLVALGEGHAWLLRGHSTFERLELPDLGEPVKDPCVALADLIKDGAGPGPRKADEAPGTIGTSMPSSGQPAPGAEPPANAAPANGTPAPSTTGTAVPPAAATAGR